MGLDGRQIWLLNFDTIDQIEKVVPWAKGAEMTVWYIENHLHTEKFSTKIDFYYWTYHRTKRTGNVNRLVQRKVLLFFSIVVPTVDTELTIKKMYKEGTVTERLMYLKLLTTELPSMRKKILGFSVIIFWSKIWWFLTLVRNYHPIWKIKVKFLQLKYEKYSDRDEESKIVLQLKLPLFLTSWKIKSAELPSK